MEHIYGVHISWYIHGLAIIVALASIGINVHIMRKRKHR